MKSLKTSNKREAERLSRALSVQFDSICLAARSAKAEPSSVAIQTPSKDAASKSPEDVLAGIPSLVRQAACRLVEEQQRDPRGWADTARRWKDFYSAMLRGAVPSEIQRPAVEAKAILNALDSVIAGKPIPEAVEVRAPQSGPKVSCESWESLVERALELYGHEVGRERHRMATLKLRQLRVEDTSAQGIHDVLSAWCSERLRRVSPRTVKTQLDSMVSCLRLVVPDLKPPRNRALKGVLQPRVGDRSSMPVDEIRKTIAVLQAKPKSTKVRAGYSGGASQFDATAVTVIACLGLRPRELFEARTASLIWKPDVRNRNGLWLRIAKGKNKNAEREIPISDGERSVLDVKALGELLAWLEKNNRSPSGLVSSLGSRFKKASGYTPYQMRHTWSDIAREAIPDFELRETILGHKVAGVATIYGSGIPLVKGLAAIEKVREIVLGE